MLKQAENLFPDEKQRENFVLALEQGISREPAIIVLKDRPEIRTFPRLAQLSWQPEFVLRFGPEFRAPQHPLYEKGAFYSLDLSSVFSASAMMAIKSRVVNVLDLCASPGGKAIFAWKAFAPQRLMCNETIRKRTGSLIANLDRCGITGSSVWSADPSVYAKNFPEAFDLVLVDAPCSGQSLLAKGRRAEGCWNPEMIDMCVGRQRRIVGNAIQCLKPGGYLLYSTCAFSIKENEKVIQWALQQESDLEAVVVPDLKEFQSKYSEEPCYRLFPQSGLGAGAFVGLIHRKESEEPVAPFEFGEVPAAWRFGDSVPEPKVKPEPPKPEPEEAPKAKKLRPAVPKPRRRK